MQLTSTVISAQPLEKANSRVLGPQRPCRLRAFCVDRCVCQRWKWFGLHMRPSSGEGPAVSSGKIEMPERMAGLESLIA
jgi:hypothetical protein